MTTHPGIQLRISGPAGPLILADSDMLHHIGKYALIEESSCDPGCAPGCGLHGWRRLIGPDMVRGTGITVEIRPVELPDRYPDG